MEGKPVSITLSVVTNDSSMLPMVLERLKAAGLEVQAVTITIKEGDHGQHRPQ